MPGLPGRAVDRLIEAMAEGAGYPGDPLRTFPAGDPTPGEQNPARRGLVTYLINDGTSKVIILDITWVG